MHIREATIDDVVHIAHIRYAAHQWFIATVANQENWFRTNRPESRGLRLVAEVDGQIVGFGFTGLNIVTSEAGASEMSIAVHPDARRRGIASALHERLEPHLSSIGAKRVRAWTEDDAASTSFAAAMGYTQGARDRYSKVDTRVLPPMPPIPDGVQLLSLREAGPQAVYEVDMAGSVDEPGDITYDGVPYDVWIDRHWNSPDQLLDVGTVAMVDGVAACAVFMEANTELGKGMSTGASTRREYRGQGLAKLAKSALLRKAAEAGIHTGITCNDYANKPMVAINDWLGYEVFSGEYSYLKTLPS